MLGLLTPWFLAGLGALSVPLLVHLIHKERKDAMPFPSLMFLEPMPVHSVRRQRIRHWWLFLLRCLAVALLVLAFARPFFKTQHAAFAATTRTSGRDIVIALDRSYSMGYGSRWTKTIAAANEAVDNMHSGDRAAIVYFAGTASAVTDLTSDKGLLHAALDSVHPTAGVTRYDAALRLVQHVFGDTAQPRREVVLVSDFQQSGWSDRNLPSLPTGTNITPVNVASASTSNAMVTTVDVRYDTSVGRERAVVEARIANRSALPLYQRPVVFELNGRQMQTQLVDCPPNGTASVTFDPVVMPPGESRGIVRLPDDSLAADNQLYFVVRRAPSLPVLVVEPDDETITAKYLTRALAIGDRLSFPVKTVRVNKLSPADLRGHALVIIDGAPIPGGDVGRALTEYVANGGGLFVALGDHSRPSSWGQNATKLLPWPSKMIDRSADRGATLGYFDRGHPVFDVFTMPHSGDVSAPRYSRYWIVTPTATDRELARFDDGHTALLERRIGAGRVLAWSSDLDALWNDLPLQPIFLPLMHQVAKYASGYTETRQWSTIGDVLTLPRLFGENPLASDSAVHTANAQYVAIAPSGTQVRFTRHTATTPASLELTESGFYTVTRSGITGDSTQTVAANVDITESDLTPLDTSLFAAVTSSGSTTRRSAQTAGSLSAADSEQRQGLWWYLLGAALLLLALETIISNRLSRPAVRRVEA